MEPIMVGTGKSVLDDGPDCDSRIVGLGQRNADQLEFWTS